VLVNAGVHHSKDPEMSLRLNVVEAVRWYKGFESQASRPCVIWKQTLPQHFHSADGGYVAANIHDVSKVKFDALMSRPGGCCAAIPKNSTTPSCCQRFNALADPLVKEAEIPHVDIYKALATVPFLHNGCVLGRHGKERMLDCTHWKKGAPEAFINQLLLLAVDNICPRSSIDSGNSSSSSNSSSGEWAEKEGVVVLLVDGAR
jgi:hypothetical protein